MPGVVLRRNAFTSDPGWESHRSRLLRQQKPRLIRQAFGYSPTNHARGLSPGEFGGFIQRSVTPAWYAKILQQKTLNDPLSASGKFAVTRAEGGSGMLFGWFHESSRGWRTSNSLAFRLDGNGGNYRVFYEYGTRNWLTGGAGCFEGEAYQTTRTPPFAADGTVHNWSIAYDPRGNRGDGLVTFILDGKPYELPLAPEHRKDGATFDRFGMFTQQTFGDGLEIYFDDIILDGKQYTFDRDPRWDAHANRGMHPDRFVRPFHDFGFSMSNYSGGGKGEIGGVVWRDELPAFYADRIQLLSLRDELYAEGKIVMTRAASDSGVYIGWFDAKSKLEATQARDAAIPKNLLGVLIEGPSRVGHYFRAVYHSSQGTGKVDAEGPIIRPDGKAHTWSLRYLPGRDRAKGRIVVMLDGQERVMELDPEHELNGVTFDRFGISNFNKGGLFVEVYIDDVIYTADRTGRVQSSIEWSHTSEIPVMPSRWLYRQ